MEQEYFQQSNITRQLPDGRLMPRRLSNDARDKRSFENFYPIHFRDRRFWLPLAVILLSLNVVWWRLPLLHTKMLQGAITWQITPLLCYTISTALGMALMMIQNFRSLTSYVFFAISILFTFSSLIQSRHEIFVLLLILCLFLIMIQQLWLGLQNVLGLLLMSILATYTVPIAIFYVQNNYVTQRFIVQLLPMLFGFIFFFTPIIMPNPDGRKLSILTLGLFWVILFSHQVGINTIFIILCSILAFTLQFVKAKLGNWQNMGYVLLQAIAMLLLYR
ncbi:hypothetical protein GCM10025879_15110 [Leuconostoc litchii]|uniref:Integral membrane protein n=1 Tax=Leuconostoc litchii TaxID=1981069 RepID=A0A652NDQ2_9LACO|nr:hypothetical protein [Leuconostoc litchii]TYC46025.1 hypothetical protein ESZ47_09185 [Leuconostoc litchii]GMA70265.1 hypothetical protein GCM10025879_15110 [Leuconostoc litchii]